MVNGDSSDLAAPAKRSRTKSKATPKPPPTVDGALVKALARILSGGAVSLAQIKAKLARALFSVSDERVAATLANMAAAGHAVELDGGRWAAGTVPLAPPPSPATPVANDVAPPPKPPPPPLTIVDILAAPLRSLRMVTKLDAELTEKLTAERAQLLVEADELARQAREKVKMAKRKTKALRQGFVARVVSVRQVPDLARNLFVTYDCSGVEPIQIKARNLSPATQKRLEARRLATNAPSPAA